MSNKYIALIVLFAIGGIALFIYYLNAQKENAAMQSIFQYQPSQYQNSGIDVMRLLDPLGLSAKN